MKTTLLLSSLCLLSAPLSHASLSPVLLSTEANYTSAPREGVKSSTCESNHYLLSLDKTGQLIIHNAVMGTRLCTIQLKDPDAILALHPDATFVAAASMEAINLYNTESGLGRKIPLAGHTVSELSWSPDGTRLLLQQLVPRADGSGTYANQACVIDAASGRTLYQSGPIETSVNLLFTPDGKGLIMTGRGELVQIDLATSQKKTLYKGSAISSVISWNPSYTALAIDTKDENLVVINPTGELLFSLPGVVGIYKMQWSVDGNILLTTEGHQGVCKQYVIDMDAKKLLPKLSELLTDRTNCQLSKSGEYIVECHNDTATIYSVLDQKKVKTIKLPGDEMRYLSPDAQELIQLDDSGYKIDSLSLGL